MCYSGRCYFESSGNLNNLVGNCTANAIEMEFCKEHNTTSGFDLQEDEKEYHSKLWEEYRNVLSSYAR